MKVMHILFLIILAFAFAEDTIPIKNITGSGSISVYKDGKVFHYKILEYFDERKKTLKAYVVRESIEEKKLHYGNFTIINADFQNLKLATILISLSKIANLNIVFSKELWKSRQEKFEPSKEYREEEGSLLRKEKGFLLQFSTLPRKVKVTRKEPVQEKEEYRIPSYLLHNVSLIINSPTPGYTLFTLFDTLLREYDLIAVKLSNNLIKISKKETLAFDVEGVDQSSINKLISKIKQYTSPSAKVLYDKDLGKIMVIDMAENIEKLRDLRVDLIELLMSRETTPGEKEKSKETTPREIETKVFYFKNKRDLEIALSRLKENFSREVILNIDKDFNAIIVTSNRSVIKSVGTLLKDLTESIDKAYLITKIFYVRYISPYELKKKIEPMLSEVGEVYTLSVSNTDEKKELISYKNTPPATAFNEGTLEKEKAFFVPFNNAILIKDYPERIEKIREKFKKFLSEKPIKIKIRAKLVEVEKSLLRELGISWRTVFSKAYIPEFWQGETAFRTVTPGQPQSGLLTFTFQRNRLNLLEFKLLAYEQEGRAKNVAESYVITVNGEPAVISSGLEFPVTEVSLSGGIANVEPKYESIPIVLITTPVVLPDGNILLSVYLARRQINSVQEFPVTQTLTQKIPVFSTSRIDVKIPIKNGETVVIGGAVEKSDSITESGVPKLREVPLLGWLFKTQTKQLRDRELLIFITPEIIEED